MCLVNVSFRIISSTSSSVSFSMSFMTDGTCMIFIVPLANNYNVLVGGFPRCVHLDLVIFLDVFHLQATLATKVPVQRIPRALRQGVSFTFTMSAMTWQPASVTSQPPKTNFLISCSTKFSVLRRVSGVNDRIEHAVWTSQRMDHHHRGAGGRAVRTRFTCDCCHFDRRQQHS